MDVVTRCRPATSQEGSQIIRLLPRCEDSQQAFFRIVGHYNWLSFSLETARVICSHHKLGEVVEEGLDVRKRLIVRVQSPTLLGIAPVNIQKSAFELCGTHFGEVSDV